MPQNATGIACVHATLRIKQCGIFRLVSFHKTFKREAIPIGQALDPATRTLPVGLAGGGGIGCEAPRIPEAVCSYHMSLVVRLNTSLI